MSETLNLPESSPPMGVVRNTHFHEFEDYANVLQTRASGDMSKEHTHEVDIYGVHYITGPSSGAIHTHYVNIINLSEGQTRERNTGP